MNTKLNHPITQYLIILALFLTGCAGGGPEIIEGQVQALQPGTTQYVIEKFINGGTAFFSKEMDTAVFARPMNGNVAWVAVKNGLPISEMKQLTGNMINIKDWPGFVECLGKAGYTSVIGTGAAYFQQILNAAASISLAETVPIFSIALVAPGELPEWLPVAEVSSE